MQRLGVPKGPIASLFGVLQKYVHRIWTAQGDPNVHFVSHSSDPIQDTGQENGCGPAGWIALSTPIMAMLHQLGFGFWAIFRQSPEPWYIVESRNWIACKETWRLRDSFHKHLHDMFGACQALPLLAQCVSAWLCLYIGVGLFQIVMPVSTSTRSSMRSSWCLRNLTSRTFMETHQTQATMARRENFHNELSQWTFTFDLLKANQNAPSDGKSDVKVHCESSWVIGRGYCSVGRATGAYRRAKWRIDKMGSDQPFGQYWFSISSPARIL